MSDEDERIQGGNRDFNSAQTSFRSLFWTIYSVLVISSFVQYRMVYLLYSVERT